MITTRPLPQPSIVRGVAFPPRATLAPLPHLRELQAEWDAEKVAKIDAGEAPSTSLVLWCSIAAGGLMIAAAFGLVS